MKTTIYTLKFVIGLIGLSLGKELNHTTLYVPGVGNIIGWSKTTVDGKLYIEYHDVPYAHVQENALFQPATPWIEQTEGFINSQLAPFCPGWENGSFDDISNCLVMQINTKNITARNPVIVYFTGYHLTPNQAGWPTGKYMLTKDVVLIAAEYRVGPYGFLSTLTDEIPGNIGLLDAIESLKWIQKHIEYFGGDPNRITVMGHNLAAGIIGVLGQIPLSDGLFHQIIYQSGSSDLDGFMTEDPLKIAKKVGQKAGCVELDKKGLTECFMDVPRDVLINAYKTVWEENDGKMYPITIGDSNGVVTSKRQRRPYPIIGGFEDQPNIWLMEEQMGKVYSRFSKTYLQEHFKEKLNILLQAATNRNNRNFKNNKQQNTTEFILNGLIETFLLHEIDIGAAKIKQNVVFSLITNTMLGGNSYAYVFKYRGSKHHFKPKMDNILRNYVTLGDDYRLISQDELDRNDRYMAEFMVNLWTSFAASGIPDSHIVWPKMDSFRGPYLIIDNIPSLGMEIQNEFTSTVDCSKPDYCVNFKM